MKRGFLDNAKPRKISQSPDTSKLGPDFKPEPVIDLSGSNLHKPPKSICASFPHRQRVVFRIWPRAPTGPVLDFANIRGKQAGNGLHFWGATIYNFFRVRRIPDGDGLSTITTGSRLAATMRAIGELDAASSEILWAEEIKPAPHQVLPKDIGKHIALNEQLMWEEVSDLFIVMGKRMPAPPTPLSPTASLFDKVSYPYPWPLTPFSTQTERLQTHIPLHLLPHKLIVHDPYNLLAVPDQNSPHRKELLSDEERKAREAAKRVPWEKKKDITHTYSLALSTCGPAKAACGGPETKEAHLYLSPAHFVGKGNHSGVYAAEWELPRAMLGRTAEFCERGVFIRRRGEHCEALGGKGDDDGVRMRLPTLAAEKLDIGNVNANPSTMNAKETEDKQTDCDLTSLNPFDFPEFAPTPLIAKVRVAAKLSIPNDPHL